MEWQWVSHKTAYHKKKPSDMNNSSKLEKDDQQKT